MIYTRIADLAVSLQGGDPSFFSERLRAYQTDETAVDLSMTVSRVSTIDWGEDTEIFRRDGRVLCRAADGGVCRYTVGKKTGRLLNRCYSNAEYSVWEYSQLESRKHPTLTLTDFEYLYTGEAFANRLAYMGGLVMHGSSIAYRGRGVVFSAPSGTGKSTHAGLWKTYYGEDVCHINDDKPAIRFWDDRPVVYGTPWSGKTDLNTNTSAPLEAIVFLKQAPHNAIYSLSPEEAMMHIHRETVRPFYDEGLGLKVLDTTQHLIQSVPTYLLECTISREAVDLVKQTLNW